MAHAASHFLLIASEQPPLRILIESRFSRYSERVSGFALPLTLPFIFFFSREMLHARPLETVLGWHPSCWFVGVGNLQLGHACTVLHM